ncbi:MAG TPA: tetratricopeptide repeat protein [Candidatus Obscuribacterales bacterium]
MTTDSATRQIKLGEILVQADIVHEHQMPRALQLAKDRSLRLGQVLIMMRYLSAEELEPILEVQRLINEGAIDCDSAIQALKVMRRDGLPLQRAVELVRDEPADKALKEHLAEQTDAEVAKLEAQPGAADRELVPPLLKSGDARMELRQWNDAERHYKRAMGILEHSHGPKNIKLSPAIIKLIELYMIQQRYADAEPMCWRLVEINQGAYGADHLEVARALQRLARVMDAQTRYPEAEQFLLSTIRIMEKQLGLESSELKSALRHLSAFWKRKTKQAEHKRIGELLVDAELLSFENLTSALQQAHKAGTPLGQMLVQLNMISHEVLRAGLQAQLLVQDGVVPASVAIKALAVVGHRGVEFDAGLEEIGWSPDPISTSELENLLDTTDELMAAEKVFGPSHPSVAAMLIKLGEQYAYAQKFAYAESSYKRALTILKQCWGQNSVELATCMFKLANLYFAQKRLTEAESLHWQVLEIRKNALGEDHAEVAQSLEQIARLQESQGNDMLANQMRQAAALIKNKNSERRIELAAFLKGNTVFKVLDEKMIDRIAGLMEEAHYAPGQAVLQDREQPEGLFIVFRGSVELTRQGSNVAYLGVGECFGDLEFPRTDQHIGAVRVPEDALLLRLPTPTIRDLKQKYPQLQAQLAAIAESRMGGASGTAQGLVLQGNLAFFDLTTVLQTICTKEGVLRLTNHKKEEVACLLVKDGGLISAKFRHLQGHWAIYDLLSRNEALDFVFEPGEVKKTPDSSLTSRPLTMLVMEAARRSDELPNLIESIGWPSTNYIKNARVLDSSKFDSDIASVAADIWMLIDDGADNEQIAEGVFADRYTFLCAMRELIKNQYIKKQQDKKDELEKEQLAAKELEAKLEITDPGSQAAPPPLPQAAVVEKKPEPFVAEKPVIIEKKLEPKPAEEKEEDNFSKLLDF